LFGHLAKELAAYVESEVNNLTAFVAVGVGA
jgi:hypothetical protein